MRLTMIKKHVYWPAVLIIIASLMMFFNFSLSADPEPTDFPSLKVKTIPETLQSKGGEMTLNAEYEGFEGSDLFVNWCVDNVPLNSFYAGSSDVVTYDYIGFDGKTRELIQE